MCNNIHHTIESFKSLVDFWLEWSIIHQNCWSMRVDHGAVAMQSVLFRIWIIQGVVFSKVPGSSSCVEVGVELMKTQFSFLFSGVPSSPFNYFRGSPDIGGGIQKLMVVTTCKVWGIWPLITNTTLNCSELLYGVMAGTWHNVYFQIHYHLTWCNCFISWCLVASGKSINMNQKLCLWHS
jgi:hypothetical protein